MEKDRYQSKVDQLCAALNLTPEAISIAEGWSLLPERAQRHVKILIDDHIASFAPELRELYSNASIVAQTRFNRVIEQAQARLQGTPPHP